MTKTAQEIPTETTDFMILDDSKKESLFKPVTRQEIETLNLFKSNLFKLQIHELMQETRVKTDLRSIVLDLKNTIEGMADLEQCLITDHVPILGNIKIPMNIPENTLLKFQFKAPKVTVIGSWLLKTCIKQPQGTSLDISLEMPEEIFQEKDHTNFRYFYKRAFYLAVVAKQLQESYSSKFTFEYNCFGNDWKRPVIIIRSTSECQPNFSKRGIFIRLIPFLNHGYFMRSRLAPSRSNVRIGEIPTPTPHYNASVLIDSYLMPHSQMIHVKIQESPALAEAISLAKIWIAQRSLPLNGFLFGMIMVWLMTLKDTKLRKIGKGYSSFQMFKIGIDLIANYDFSQPLFLTENGKAIEQDGFDERTFREAYDICIVDPTGTFNLAYGMTKSGMDLVQYEAKLAMVFLQDPRDDRFSDLFLKTADQPWLKYDNVFKIPVLTADNVCSYNQQQQLDYGSVTPHVLKELYKILQKGLNDRAYCIAISADSISSWSLESDIPNFQKATGVTIGVILNPETCLREVEHGPNSEDIANVESFKHLWGQRSETRRFQDGSIKEAVVFQCDGTVEQRSILVARSTAFLLSRHFKVDQDDGVTYWAGLGNKYLKSFGQVPTVLSFQGIADAFQSLTKQLRSLDLPLAIHRMLPTSDSLSYCSPLIPQPIETHELVSRANLPEFLIEFETSSKWPDDVGAIETMKRAFYIRISTLLEKSDFETIATVCIGQGNESYLRFNHSSGYMFKARIHHPRVGYLLQKALKENPDNITKASLIEYQRKYVREFINLPSHYNQINNLCLRYAFLGQTIRLAKRWMASHMLLGTGIPAEVVEIICVRVFTVPNAFGPPASGWTGFVRVLDLLGTFKWDLEPLVVELEREKMTADIHDEIIKNFHSTPKPSGKIAMFVATELDRNSSWWGTHSISSKIIQRIAMLSKACLSAVKNQLLHGTNNDISQLFLTSTEDYHAVIHLDTTKLLSYFNSITFDASRAPAKTSKFKNILDSHDKNLMELSYINPLQMFIEELNQYFGDVAMFFADIYGGDKIAVVWKSEHLVDTGFKVNVGYNAMTTDQLTNGKSMVTPNRYAMLSEMERLGAGLVVGIEC